MSGSKPWLLGAFVGVCVLALGQARAGTLEIVISEGATSYDILSGGPLDMSGAPPNNINAIASALVFPDFTIVGLHASTNDPGAANPVGATLSMGGEIKSLTGVTSTLTITVTDTDYTVPAGAGLIVTSRASDTDTGGATGTHGFTSYINPNNTPAATQIGTGPLSFSLDAGHNSGETPLTGQSVPAPYGLTSVTTLTVGGPAGQADVVFTGGTIVTSAIPEPVSVTLLGTGIAVVILVRCRRALRRSSR